MTEMTAEDLKDCVPLWATRSIPQGMSDESAVGSESVDFPIPE